MRFKCEFCPEEFEGEGSGKRLMIHVKSCAGRKASLDHQCLCGLDCFCGYPDGKCGDCIECQEFAATGAVLVDD